MKLFRKYKNIRERIHKYEYYTTLEIYSHFRNDLNTLKIILNKLSVLKYPVWPHFDKKYTIVNHQFNAMLKDDNFLKYLTNDSMRIRIEMESKFINYWAMSIASIYLAINYNENPIKNDNVNIFTENLFNTILAFNSDDNIYFSKIWNILYEFYNDNDESKFKDKIVDYILTMCEILTDLLHISYEGVNFFDFFTNSSKYEDEKKERIFQKISNDLFTKRIEKRKLQKKELINKQFIQKLDDNLKHYEYKVSNFMNPCIVKYYIILFKKFFTLENKKIEKNNVIDSLLLSYYPNNLIITADEDFLKIMNEINSSYYNKVRMFLDNCKKGLTAHNIRYATFLLNVDIGA
ncbi:hypothetical protein FACS189494_04630 [Spirochaetia bacterium]|nr:hypothetical protein FACS189494_04630 [Spirochaetia bacterium]